MQPEDEDKTLTAYVLGNYGKFFTRLESLAWNNVFHDAKAAACDSHSAKSFHERYISQWTRRFSASSQTAAQPFASVFATAYFPSTVTKSISIAARSAAHLPEHLQPACALPAITHGMNSERNEMPDHSRQLSPSDC
jgi:hypothetical protein